MRRLSFTVPSEDDREQAVQPVSQDAQEDAALPISRKPAKGCFLLHTLLAVATVSRVRFFPVNIQIKLDSKF